MQARLSATSEGAPRSTSAGRAAAGLAAASLSALSAASASRTSLCEKQGRIHRPDVPQTANPRPLAVPCPGGAGRDRTGNPGLPDVPFFYPHHELAKLGRHGRTNFSMSRLRPAGSPARSCCRGGKAVSLLSKEPSSLVLLVRATGGLSLLHNRLRREHALRSSRRSMHAGEGLLCRRWGLHGWRARVADHAVHAPIAPKGVRPNMRILRPKG